MSDAPPDDKSKPFDVAMIVGVSEDNERAQVLRLRPESAELGEIRPLRDGVPIGSGEIVQLRSRPGAPQLYDVNVQHSGRELQSGQPAQADKPAEAGAKRAAGPAQVSTESYRTGWERIFSQRAGGGAGGAGGAGQTGGGAAN